MINNIWIDHFCLLMVHTESIIFKDPVAHNKYVTCPTIIRLKPRTYNIRSSDECLFSHKASILKRRCTKFQTKFGIK